MKLKNHPDFNWTITETQFLSMAEAPITTYGDILVVGSMYHDCVKEFGAHLEYLNARSDFEGIQYVTRKMIYLRDILRAFKMKRIMMSGQYGV